MCARSAISPEFLPSFFRSLLDILSPLFSVLFSPSLRLTEKKKEGGGIGASTARGLLSLVFLQCRTKPNHFFSIIIIIIAPVFCTVLFGASFIVERKIYIYIYILVS